jgi:hypothetical protein
MCWELGEVEVGEEGGKDEETANESYAVAEEGGCEASC